MPKGYDPRCEELGRLFLGDEPDLLTDTTAAELAQEIQDVIEDFIREARDAGRIPPQAEKEITR